MMDAMIRMNLNFGIFYFSPSSPDLVDENLKYSDPLWTQNDLSLWSFWPNSISDTSDY